MDIWYIKLHRKILEWEWYSDSNVTRVFIHFLLIANREEKKWRGVTIPKWSLVTGRLQLSETLWLSEQQIRTAVNKLKSTNEITIKSTSSFSLIEVINWQLYQEQSTNKKTNKQPTDNQQITTPKEVKNIEDKNIETSNVVISEPHKKTPKEIAEEFFATDPEEIVSSLSVDPEHREKVLREVRNFISWWTEPNSTGSKLKWQKQDTFEVSRRLRTWFDRAGQHSTSSHYKPHGHFTE